MMRIYDSARQQVVPMTFRDEGKTSIYVCGPTVYGPPHIGHGRHTLTYDVLRRFLIWAGYDVTFVSNITDIDDNIINRANDENRDWSDIAVKCEAVWWRAMDALNVARPDHAPHATEYVEEMVELIEELLRAEKAYLTPDGVYLSVEQVDGYGLLAHQSLDDLRAGGGDRELVGSDKKHPADFVLWKLVKPGEPSWPSPWGDGRPGWHTECVVMSLGLLGEGFDLHTGGLDLTFPHHENERAQAVALGRDFARHWMHHGFVELEGEKMSKSLGNVENLLDLIDDYDPRAYRLLVLQSHYRSPMEVTETTLSNAVAAVDRLDSFARRTASLDGAPSSEVIHQFRAAMENDLETAKAVDLLFRQVREANTALDQGDTEAAASAAAAAIEIASVLGLDLKADADEVPGEIQALAHERQEARQAKDFVRADQLRDQLSAAGWSVEDSADGPVLRRLT
ncbi:MAG: cysteine--tRNA ligase [Acidimicrobiia bacterium]|nr:cysteine--tRNA ligase [Acidimicrobiia bacterium]